LGGAFRPKMNFIFSDAEFHRYTGVNRAPVGTEPSKWSSDHDDPQARLRCGRFPAKPKRDREPAHPGGNLDGENRVRLDLVRRFLLIPFLRRIRRPDGINPHFQMVWIVSN